MIRAAFAVGLLLGCRGNVADPEGAPPIPPTVTGVDADLLLPWSQITVHGEGFLQPPAGRTIVVLRGAVGGARVEERLAPAQSSARQLRLVVDPALVSVFDGREGAFVGSLEVTTQPTDQTSATSAPFAVELRFSPAAEPRLDAVTHGDVWPGSHLAVSGDGLVDGGEGRSALLLTGRFEPEEGGAFSVRDEELPLTSRLGRTSGTVYLRPAVLGLAPGAFVGDARLRTTDAAGLTRESDPVPIELRQRPPEVEALEPPAASRGQVLVLSGAGFLPNDPGAETATLVRADGLFRPTFGEPYPVRLSLVPERWVDHRELRLALRTRFDAGGQLTGLGTVAGVFEGALAVELFAGRERARSQPLQASFRVAGQTQTVRLRYLPGFSETLEDFGLREAEPELRARILAVCRRDYDGLRIRFNEEPPVEFAEYVTVEIGGRDPNGLGLFGLDNTPLKDEGNTRLDELLGGRNAESEAAAQLPYGGVFLASFLALSPSNPRALPLAHPRFDEVFGPFAPAVDADARPYRASETVSPARAAALQIALDALANLVGSTITHEVGHALGLAVGADSVHNASPAPGALMDAGEERPFLERAALDGVPPAAFNGANRAYLEALFGEDAR